MTKKIYVDVFVFLLLHIYRRPLSPPFRKFCPILDVPLMGENVIIFVKKYNQQIIATTIHINVAL